MPKIIYQHKAFRAEEARERSTLEALSRRWDNVQDYIRTLDARDGL